MLAGVEKGKSRKGVCLFCGEWLPLLDGERAGASSLGDESSLGEKAAFLFLGLAVDGDLNGHLGCVLGMMSVTVTDGFSPAPTYLVNVRLGT